MHRGYGSPQIGPILVLIGINLLVFILTEFVDPGLIRTLGLQPAALAERPWTIVTNLFVHGGLGHILANMITLFFFGSYLMGMAGQMRFLLVYFLGGLTGNVFYIFLADPMVIGIGASGAVFAVGGALVILSPSIRVFVFPLPVPIPLWLAVLGAFFILNLFPQVAWQAHAGGLLFGLAGGFIMKRVR